MACSITEPVDECTGAPHRERGVGLLSTLVGFIIFIFFMFLGTHLLLHLYASSLTSGAAYDAASSVARARNQADRPGAAALAEAELRDALGAWGNDVDITWDINLVTVTVRVRGRAPSLLPASLTDASGLDIDRSATVRLEEFRDPA